MIGLVLAVLAIGLGIFLTRQRNRLVLNAEYWVYCQAEKLPDQTQMMERVVGRTDKIGPAEGLLFSDIRLHVSLVTKAKNPHLFDPTTLDGALQESFEFVSDVLTQTAIIRVRFTSNEPMKDKRHLRLLPHLAFAYAGMTDAKWVYDKSQQKLYGDEEFGKFIETNLENPWNQLRVDKTVDGALKLYGVEKIGIAPFQTDRLDVDQFQLVEEVLRAFVEQCWRANKLDTTAIEAHGDTFEFQFDARKGLLHISRRRTA
ncbi:MAG TPA: hypothetical protein VK171_10355 [Fimbriimonas sp.]|nr:hypothetical protein [Fimbriimonas sp.]